MSTERVQLHTEDQCTFDSAAALAITRGYDIVIEYDGIKIVNSVSNLSVGGWNSEKGRGWIDYIHVTSTYGEY
jgi:hypothetical protein